MTEIVASCVWLVVELLFVCTGKAVIWSLSLGRWRSESLLEDESRVFAAAGALSFVRDGKRVITTTGMLFAGVAFYVLLVVASLLYAAKA
jgi:hypothetical protein